MVAKRLLEIFTLMAIHERENPHGVPLCAVAHQVTELSGAGISITSNDDTRTKLCTSNHVAQSLMDLEITLEEGPGQEASTNGTAIEVADLMEGGHRWPFYSPGATDLGVRAVFGFPIQIGASVFGALSLYRDSTGPLSEKQSSDAYLMATIIGRAVLAMQASALSGTISDELQGRAALDFSFHQAAGMLSVQAELSVKDALVMLRSHAFVLDLSPSELAQRVIEGETRFDLTANQWTEARWKTD